VACIFNGIRKCLSPPFRDDANTCKSPMVISFLTIGSIFFILFIIVEWRVSRLPMIPSKFRIQSLAILCLTCQCRSLRMELLPQSLSKTSSLASYSTGTCTTCHSTIRMCADSQRSSRHTFPFLLLSLNQ
jgi:hypothetical protein